jgi:hypothetical protein
MKRSFHKTEVRAISDGKFEIVISGEAVDRHRTVLTADEWELKDYNGVFYWMHSTFSDDPDVALGESRIFFDNRFMVAEAEWPERGHNLLADKVRGHVERGTIKMASVGFAPMEAGRMGDPEKGEPEVYHYGRRELLEWSLVHVGSYKQAFKRDVDDTNNYIKNELKRLDPGEGIAADDIAKGGVIKMGDQGSRVIHPSVGVARCRYYHFLNQN